MSPHFPTPSACPQFAKPAMCNFLEAASLLAPDRSGPSPEFLESFVYGMLGTLITGCLCISVIGPLFSLEECKLSEPQDGLPPFSQSQRLAVPFWGLSHLHLTGQSSTDLSQLSPKCPRAGARSYSTSHPHHLAESPAPRSQLNICSVTHLCTHLSPLAAWYIN